MTNHIQPCFEILAQAGTIEAMGNDVVPALAIGCTFLFLTIWVIAATIDSLYKTRCNAHLKEELVSKGATANEIDQILRAGINPNENWSANQPAPPIKNRYSNGQMVAK